MSRRLKVPLAILAVVLVALLAYLFAPWGDPDLSSRPAPARTYDEAVTRIDALTSADASAPLSETGRSIALLHGSRTTSAVVIFHGFTAAPGPFRTIAQAYFDAGYNVWVPRAPYHGYADRMTEDISRLTPQDLRAYADSSIDIGAGLAENVVVVGQSGGGVLAEWALAERPEVVRVTAISPFFLPKEGLPLWAMRPLARYLDVAPDMWKWWDEELKGSEAALANAPNAYPRGSVRAMSAYLTLGRWLRDVRAASGKNPNGDITLVVNEADPSIDGGYNVAVTRMLGTTGLLSVYTIPLSDGLEHDLVDAQDRNRDHIDVAYRHLSRALGIELPDPRPKE